MTDRIRALIVSVGHPIVYGVIVFVVSLLAQIGVH